MKPTLTLRNYLLGSALLAAVTTANAADLYWDTDGTTAGFGTTLTGTWGTSAFWNSSSAGTAATANTTTTHSDTIHFGTATDGYTGAISVNGTQEVGGITVGAASPKHPVNSYSVRFDNGGINIAGNTIFRNDATAQTTIM